MSKNEWKNITEQDQEILDELSEDKLSAKQEMFCQLFATKGSLFGNGVQTYLEVYDVDETKPNWYKTACSAASRLLSNVKVYTRINQLLEENWLNDVEVDKQLKYLIEQHSDLWVKMRAIDSYNKLKQRLTDKIEVSGTVSYQLVDDTK